VHDAVLRLACVNFASARCTQLTLCSAVLCYAVQVEHLEQRLEGEQARLASVTGELTVSQQQVKALQQQVDMLQRQLRDAATAAQAELAAEVGSCGSPPPPPREGAGQGHRLMGAALRPGPWICCQIVAC
jgi:hypothetical protein